MITEHRQIVFFCVACKKRFDHVPIIEMIKGKVDGSFGKKADKLIQNHIDTCTGT